MTGIDRAALSLALARGAHDLGVMLSDRQRTKSIDYLALLVKWSSVYNLSAIRDPALMVTQHLLDSLALAPALDGALNVLDVGSGGGLPGIVLAIWAEQALPDARVALIDTVQKKTAFLTQVKVELGLSNVTVHTGRVEQMQVLHKFDLITSRAFAELSDFVRWSSHLLAEGGRFVAMKGRRPEQEIERLDGAWRVSETRRIEVPGLGAERNLVFIERA